MTPSSTPRPAPAPRGTAAAQDAQHHAQYDLVQRQLEGLDRWHAARRVQQDMEQVRSRSREQRLDLSRRMDVVRAQHRAIVERTDAQLRDSLRVLQGSARPRVLVAHRNAWFTEKVTSALVEHGLEVVGQLTNGAEAVGFAVAEQPDLVVVEESLPMLPGEAVVREVRALAPRTLVAAQVASEEGVATMLLAGATAAYARRVPPAEVAAELAGLLQRRPT